MRSHYQSLRLLNLFLDSFGHTLAPLITLLPETNAAITPTDVKTLRFSARGGDGVGFLFLMNYQDHFATTDLAGTSIRVTARKQTITVPRSVPSLCRAALRRSFRSISI